MKFFNNLKPKALFDSSSQAYSTTTVSSWYARNGYRLPISGGGDSYTGEAVGPISSLQLSTVYACVKITGEDVGSQPAGLYRRSKDGKSNERAVDDYRYTKFHDAPNPDMGAGEFQEALTARACMMGAGVALIENPGRTNMALWPLGGSDSFRTETDSKRRTIWIVKEGNAQEKALRRDQLFVLRGLTFDGRNGDYILERARHVIGLGLASQRYAGEFLKNDAGAALFLKHPNKPGDKESIWRMLRAWRKGGSRDDWPEDLRSRERGDPRFLWEGMEPVRLDPDLEKQQLVETRKHQIEEVARMFRVPLHKLAHLDRMTFNNIEEMQIDYDSAVMNPWRRRWKEAFYRHILTDSEHLEGRLYLDLSAEAMLRGRFKDQAEGFAKLLQNGVYSINQVLKFLNMNPIEGGDSHFMQLSMREVQKLAAAAVTK